MRLETAFASHLKLIWDLILIRRRLLIFLIRRRLLIFLILRLLRLRGRLFREEGVVVKELLHHRLARLGLVHWNHVPSTMKLEECETLRLTRTARLLAIHHPRCILSRLEISSTMPLQPFDPGLVPEPVADEVLVPCIDEYCVAVVKQRWHHLRVTLEPVSLECEVDSGAAIFPFGRHPEHPTHTRGIEVGLHVAEGVAERRVAAALVQVVDVLARRLHG